MNANVIATGKTHRQENFPVASRLIGAEHRPVIMAFYGFARAADDVADDPHLTAPQKTSRLDAMEESLLGSDSRAPEASRLRVALAERGLTPRHAQDLLTAFRMDVFKRRHPDWDSLMSYCAYSAMPVGRFVLDVHGESRATWAASDAVCAALQIINHLQDCGADYRNLDRVYIPLGLMAAHDTRPEDLAADSASRGLRACLREIAGKVANLLGDGRGLADQIGDRRLRLEIAVIQALAERLTGLLTQRDPLSEQTHLNGLEAAATACLAILRRGAHGFGLTSRALPSGARP